MTSSGRGIGAGCALAALAVSASAQKVDSFSSPKGTQQTVVAGPASSLTPGSAAWAWDGGSQIAPFRNALHDPNYFGPTGIVGGEISTLNLVSIDSTSLAGVDLFVASWWLDTETPQTAVDALVEFFLGGGSLLLYQDDPQHDRIGEALGIPTLPVEANGSPSNGPAPFFDGPFGPANNVEQFGNKGQLPLSAVQALDGSIAAVNSAGQVTAAMWLPGQYAEGAGSLLVVADVDMMAATKANYFPLNDNGVFTLNGVPLLALDGPGTLTPYGCGLNAPGSLVILDGTPDLGETLRFGLDNPFGTQGAGSLSYVAVSLLPDGQFPCGSPIPGLGMGFPGQSAELLISFAPPNPIAFLTGSPWGGPGQPAPVPLLLPFHPAFVNLTIYGQGILFDPFATFGISAALTDAVQVVIGTGS